MAASVWFLYTQVNPERRPRRWSQLGSRLGPYWDVIGPIFGPILGPRWLHLGTIFGPYSAHDGPAHGSNPD